MLAPPVPQVVPQALPQGSPPGPSGVPTVVVTGGIAATAAGLGLAMMRYGPHPAIKAGGGVLWGIGRLFR